MKILDLKENKVIIAPEVLEIPQFKVLWNRDKTKTKEQALNELKFIFYSLDNTSPYADFPEKEKDALLAKDIFNLEKYTPDVAVQAAMEKFILLAETPTQRLFTSVKQKINALSDYLNTAVVTEDSITSILKVIESTSKLIGQLSTLQQAVDKENEDSKQKVRGGKKIGRYED